MGLAGRSFTNSLPGADSCCFSGTERPDSPAVLRDGDHPTSDGFCAKIWAVAVPSLGHGAAERFAKEQNMNSCDRTPKITMLLGLSAWLAFALACSSGTSSSPSSGNGGATSTGGTSEHGGAAGASTMATGGVSSSGGNVGTGGAQATGGAVGSGGTTTSGSGGTTTSGSGGTTGYPLPPACPVHTPLACPAIDSTKSFGSLSAADVSALCDCKITAYGGLGTSQTCRCSDGSMAMNANPTSKDACIASYKATSACTWLMSDYFKCMDLTQDLCNMMGLAQSLGDPSCAGGMNNTACTIGQ